MGVIIPIIIIIINIYIKKFLMNDFGQGEMKLNDEEDKAK
ncbi:hypothetical protein AO385_0436 [Moraxella catarrhalis]|uniref:Uncharacterized protein n=1 Tax=Moraxella catarrhalis TaxID=480 RepID=A0A198UP62_MORCA|nr:hypothetical protein AO384_0159 [Moraxella catarrhalis]OAU98398.1 hypothetical protein AO383_0636 [Moraxella catarrhalis]OAV03610.1 hypothetical protein AO385_0436 [Moraxella catarrhalis]